MGAQHTPGPWIESGDSNWYPDRYETTGNASWTVIRSDSADYDVAIVMHSGRHDDPILDANARLIAAAPALLEALAPFARFLDALEAQSNAPKEGVWYALEVSGVGVRELTVEDFKSARAALSLARGETP